MKYEVQEFMVSNKKQMENLEEWSNQFEEKVLRYDVLGDTLKNELRATMKKEGDQEKQKEREKHEKMFRRRMKEELGKSRKKRWKFRRRAMR